MGNESHHYNAFLRFPVTGPVTGPPIPTPEARIVRVLLAGPGFSARVQVSNAQPESGNPALFLPPESSWVAAGTLGPGNGILDLHAPVRWVRVVLDGGTLSSGTVEEDTRARGDNAADDTLAPRLSVVETQLQGDQPRLATVEQQVQVAQADATTSKRRLSGILNFSEVYDGTSPQTVRASLKQALTDRAGGGKLLIPPGVWTLDNSDPNNTLGLTVTNFRGTLEGDGELRFTDPTKRGLSFYGGSPRIDGLTLSWASVAPARVAEGLVAENGTEWQVSNSEVRNAPGASFIGYTNDHQAFFLCRAYGGQADAFHAANHLNALMLGLYTEDAGDDMFAFVDYTSRRANLYGHMVGLTGVRGQARGIALVGGTNQTVTGFSLFQPRVAGVYIVGEAATRNPQNSMVANGVIADVGNVAWNSVAQASRSPVLSGVYLENTAGASLTNLLIDGVQGRGVVIGNSRAYLDALTIRNTQSTGLHVVNGSMVRFGRVTAELCAEYGLFADTDVRIRGARFDIWNCAGNRTDGVVANILGDLQLSQLMVEDDRATPKGYAVRMIGTGNIGDVSTAVPNGSLTVEDPNSRVRAINGLRQELQAISVRVTATGQGLRVVMPTGGILTRLDVEQEGTSAGASGVAGVALYGAGYTTYREANLTLTAGGDGTRSSLAVNTSFVASETLNLRWVSAFGTTPPTALNLTAWYKRR